MLLARLGHRVDCYGQDRRLFWCSLHSTKLSFELRFVMSITDDNVFEVISTSLDITYSLDNTYSLFRMFRDQY